MASAVGTEYVPDPRYSLTKQLAPAISDTSARTVQLIEDPSGIAPVKTSPLNDAIAGHTTTFQLEQGSLSRWRWGTSALRLQMYFETDAPAATVPMVPAAAQAPAFAQQAPDWNLVAQLISQITLKMNGETIYTTKTPGHYVEDFTARLLRYHSWEELNNNDTMLFTPIGAKRYTTRALGLDAAYANFTDQSVEWQERATKYCGGGTTQLQPIVKIIPFADLFPRMPDAIFRNLRSLWIEIVWVKDTNLLSGIGQATQAVGRVHLSRASLLMDTYVPGGANPAQTVMEKAEDVDIISFLMPNVEMTDFSANGRMVAHAVSNLDSVMIMQLAKGHTSDAAGVTASYPCAGEFLLASDSLAANLAAMRRTADAPGSHGITSVTLQYNNQTYPQQPISLSSGVATDSQIYVELYHEYLKSLDRTGHMAVSGAIPYDVFRTTMPFICLRPHSNSGNRLSSASDLTILTTTSGAANSFTAGKQVALIWFQLKVFQIAPTGKITFVSS